MKHVPIACCFCLFLSLVGCTDPQPTPYPTAVTSTSTNQLPARPYITVQFCSDDTSSYPREDFKNANTLMATSLINAVRSNQSGLKLYASAITHNTFDPANSLSPVFTITAIPAYPVPPKIIPTPTPFNVVTDRATKITVLTTDNAVITAYNAQVQEIDKQIQSQVNAITQDTNRLKDWNIPVDNTATSVFGCFEIARSNFKNQSGVKLLYIASDFENNTSIDFTNELVTSHGLDGVIVHSIFFYSENAVRAQQKMNEWCPILKAAGAKSVTFDERTRSTALASIDLFTTDATTTDSSC